MTARIPDMLWLWRVPRDTHSRVYGLAVHPSRKGFSGERVLVLSEKCRRDK